MTDAPETDIPPMPLPDRIWARRSPIFGAMRTNDLDKGAIEYIAVTALASAPEVQELIRAETEIADHLAMCLVEARRVLEEMTGSHGLIGETALKNYAAIRGPKP